MIIRDIESCEYFEAMDKPILCELLHPDREDEDLKMDLSISHAILEPLKSSIPHKLKNSVEIYYILQGKGIMHIDEEREDVKSGQIIYIPPNSKQYLENTENEELTFFVLSIPCGNLKTKNWFKNKLINRSINNHNTHISKFHSRNIF